MIQEYCDISIFVTNKGSCYNLHPSQGQKKIVSTKIPPFSSNQEEADTRIIFHAQDVSLTSKIVVVQTPDTNVIHLDWTV